MITRAINALMSDGKYTVLQRHWCALIGTCTVNTHAGFIVYLFIGFDLENEMLAWPQWKWSLNWAWSLRGLVLGVSDQTNPACSFFEALQKHG